MGDMAKDSRFSHIGKDPRFKTIPRSQRQVKIDKRFQAMFKDDRFKTKYSVDKRGRPISRTSNEDLERYYALSSSDSDSDEDENEDDTKDDAGPSKPSKSKKDKSVLKSKTSKSKDSEEIPSDDSAEEDSASEDNSLSDIVNGEDGSHDEEITDKIKAKLHDMSVDYARGEGAIMSDSSSDEESSDEESDGAVEHGWGELDKDAETTEEETSRLAICNMDWDRIRAIDLMVLLNSFIPPGGLIRSVTIYPSEFGLERMKIEEEEGPPELVESSSKTKNANKNKGRKEEDKVEEEEKEKEEEEEEDSDSEQRESGEEADNSANYIANPEEENEEGSSYHREKLRQYQLNRLKYYYAVVECDSANTANHIYTECDGLEYESSATRLDLRFVPDDTTFDQEPKETCTEMPDTAKYRPRYFTTSALQQANVELTWDETDPNRAEISNRLMSGDTVDDNDLRTYLASSSEEEDETEKKEVSQKGKGNGVKNGKKGKGKKSKEKGSSADEDSDKEDPIAKYRSLLSGIEEEEKEKKNKGVHMEISWGLGLKEKTEEVMKKKNSNSEELTPFEKMMEKRKQKRQEKKKLKLQRKTQTADDSNDEEKVISDDEIPSDIDMNDPYFAEEFKDMKKNSKKKKVKKHEDSDEDDEEKKSKAELELLLLDKDDRKHFNFKKIQEEESTTKSKRKQKAARRKKEKGLQEDTQDDFKVNVDDDRFSALYSSHHYNIDPTDSHFRKSNGMEALISAKQKRLVTPGAQVMDSNHPPPKKSKKDAELSLLVKSVKNKAQKLKKQ